MSLLFSSFFFPPFFPSSILGKRHNGWETLWYVTDMNIIPPPCSRRRRRRRHFAAVTRNIIRIPLSCSYASHNVIVADTPWRSLILFKPVWPLTRYMTTIPSCDHRADTCMNEDRPLFLQYCGVNSSLSFYIRNAFEVTSKRR